MCALCYSPVNTFMASLALSATLSGCATPSPVNALSQEKPPPVVVVDRATLPIAPTSTPVHAISTPAISSPDTVRVATANETPAPAVLGGHAGEPARPGDPSGTDAVLERAHTTAPDTPSRCQVRPGLLADNLTRLATEYGGKPVIWTAPFDVPIEVGAEIPAADFLQCVDTIVRSVQASHVAIRAIDTHNAIVIEER